MIFFKVIITIVKVVFLFDIAMTLLFLFSGVIRRNADRKLKHMEDLRELYQKIQVIKQATFEKYKDRLNDDSEPTEEEKQDMMLLMKVDHIQRRILNNIRLIKAVPFYAAKNPHQAVRKGYGAYLPVLNEAYQKFVL